MVPLTAAGPTLSDRHVRPDTRRAGGHPHHSALPAHRAPHVRLWAPPSLRTRSGCDATSESEATAPSLPVPAGRRPPFLPPPLRLRFGCAARKKSVQLPRQTVQPHATQLPHPWPRPPPPSRRRRSREAILGGVLSLVSRVPRVLSRHPAWIFAWVVPIPPHRSKKEVFRDPSSSSPGSSQGAAFCPSGLKYFRHRCDDMFCARW